MGKKKTSKTTGAGEFALSSELLALQNEGVVVEEDVPLNETIIAARLEPDKVQTPASLSEVKERMVPNPVDLDYEKGRLEARAGNIDQVVDVILASLREREPAEGEEVDIATVSQYVRTLAGAGAEAVMGAYQSSLAEPPASPTAAALAQALTRLANYYYFTTPDALIRDNAPKAASLNILSFYGSLRDRVLTSQRNFGTESASRLLYDIGVEPGLVSEVLRELVEGEQWAVYVPYSKDYDGEMLAAQKDKTFFTTSERLRSLLGIEARWMSDNKMISLPPMLSVQIAEGFLKLDQPASDASFPIVNPYDLMDYYKSMATQQPVEALVREYEIGKVTGRTIRDLLPMHLDSIKRHDFPIYQQRYKSNETDQLFLGYYIGVIQQSIQELKQQVTGDPGQLDLVIRQLKSRGAATMAVANSHILSNGTPQGQMGRLQKCLEVVQSLERRLLALLFRPESRTSTAEARTLRLNWQRETLPLLASVVLKSCRFHFPPDFRPQVNYSKTIEKYVEEKGTYPPWLQLNKEASAGPLYPSETKRDESFIGEVVTQDLLHQYIRNLDGDQIEVLINGKNGENVWAYFKLCFLKAKYEVETREKYFKGTRNYFPSVCGGQLTAGVWINASHSAYDFPWTPGCSRTHCLLGFTPYNGGMNSFVDWIATAELLTPADPEEQQICMDLYRHCKMFLLSWSNNVNAAALGPLNKVITFNTRDDLLERTRYEHKPDLSGEYINTATVIRERVQTSITGEVGSVRDMSFITCVGSHWVVYSDNLYIIWKVKISGAKCPLYEDHLENEPVGEREYRMYASTDGSKMESCVSKYHAQAWYAVTIDAFKYQHGDGALDPSWEKYLRHFHPNASFNQHCIWQKAQFINPGQGSGIQGTAQFNTSAMCYLAYTWFTLGGTFLVPVSTSEGEEWTFSLGGELSQVLCGMKLTVESVLNLTAIQIDFASEKNQVLPLDLLGYEAVRATAFEGPTSRAYWPRLKLDRLQRVLCFTDVDRKENTLQTMNIKQWMLHMSKLASLWLLGGWSFPEIKDTMVIVQGALKAVFESRFGGLKEAIPYSDEDVSNVLMQLAGVRDSTLTGFTMETLVSGGFQFMTPYSLYQLYFGSIRGMKWLRLVRDLPGGAELAALIKQKDSIVNSKLAVKRVLAASARLVTLVDPLARNENGTPRFPNLIELTQPRPWSQLKSKKAIAAAVLEEIKELISPHLKKSPVQQIPTNVMIIPALETNRNCHLYSSNAANLEMFKKCFSSFWVALTQFCYPDLIPLWLQANEEMMHNLRVSVGRLLLFTHINKEFRAAVSTTMIFKGSVYSRAYRALTEAAMASSDLSTQIMGLEASPLPAGFTFNSGRLGKRKAGSVEIEEEPQAGSLLVSGLRQMAENLAPSSQSVQSVSLQELMPASDFPKSFFTNETRERLEASRLRDVEEYEELEPAEDSLQPEDDNIPDDSYYIGEESVTTSKRPRFDEDQYIGEEEPGQEEGELTGNAEDLEDFIEPAGSAPAPVVPTPSTSRFVEGISRVMAAQEEEQRRIVEAMSQASNARGASGGDAEEWGDDEELEF